MAPFFIQFRMRSSSPSPSVPEAPRFVMVPGQCDLTCIWCNYRSNPPKEPMDFGRLLGQLEGLYAQGVRRVCFGHQSSEPTTCSDFPELVLQAHGMGFQSISLYTSGLRLSELAYVRRLKSCGLSAVNISLPGIDETIADILLGRAGATAAKLAALEHCASEGLQASATLMFVRPALSGMRRSVEGLRALASRWPESIRFQGTLLSPVVDEDPRRYPLFWPSYGEVAWTMRDIKTSAPDFKLFSSDAPSCVAGRIPGLCSERQTMPRIPYVKPAKSCGRCRFSRQCPGVFAPYIKSHGGVSPASFLRGVAPRIPDVKMLAKQIRELKEP